MDELAEEKSFRAVFSWACISMPTVNSHFSRVWRYDFEFFFSCRFFTACFCIFKSSFSCLEYDMSGIDLVDAVVVCNARTLRKRWLRHPALVTWPPNRYLLRVEAGMRAIGLVVAVNWASTRYQDYYYNCRICFA